MNSICIATYNGEKYIVEQLNSILGQIADDDEVVISDNGSLDNTLKLISGINDSRISVYTYTDKQGATYNFANALSKCKGEIIFLADQDDVWFDNKYDTCLEQLKHCDLVHADSIVTDNDLNVIHDSFYKVLNNGKGIVKNVVKSTYYGSHMAFKRRVLEYAQPFPATIEIGHDLWLGLIAELIGEVCFIQDKLMYYRRHEDAYCDIDNASKRPLYKKAYGRILMLVYLLRFCFKKRL